MRNFVAVAEELHFARAAARLGMEQSPLSRSIQDLEADLKIRLFARTRRSTALTPAGATFLITAKRILTDAEMALREMRTFEGGQPLRVGLAEGMAGPGFRRLLRAAVESERPVPPSIVERPLSELLALCATEALDGVLAPEETATAELISVAAWEKPLVVVGGEIGGPARLSDLPDVDWILPDPHTMPGVAQQIERLLRDAGHPGRIATVAATPAAMVCMAKAGLGCGLLPAGIAPVVDGVEVRPLCDPKAKICMWLTLRREDADHPTQRLRGLVANLQR